MIVLQKAVKIEVMDGLIIRVYFKNNEKRILDIIPYCTGEIFKDFLKNEELFKTARLDELGGIVWSNGASLSPETVSLKSK